MSEIKLTTEGLRYLSLFESLTGAMARDCIIEDDRIMFVVKPGDMGMAIGKNGANIDRVRKTLDKQVEVIEFNEDAKKFIKNLFQPATIKKVSIQSRGNKRLAYVEVTNRDKGLAIGKNGRNINKVKMLAQRHHSLDDVIIQ